MRFVLSSKSWLKHSSEPPTEEKIMQYEAIATYPTPEPLRVSLGRRVRYAYKDINGRFHTCQGLWDGPTLRAAQAIEWLTPQQFDRLYGGTYRTFEVVQ
jgi:hypothetical protein